MKTSYSLNIEFCFQLQQFNKRIAVHEQRGVAYFKKAKARKLEEIMLFDILGPLKVCNFYILGMFLLYIIVISCY